MGHLIAAVLEVPRHNFGVSPLSRVGHPFYLELRSRLENPDESNGQLILSPSFLADCNKTVFYLRRTPWGLIDTGSQHLLLLRNANLYVQ